MTTFHHQIKSGKKGSAAPHSDYIARHGKHGKREDLMMTGSGNLPSWTENNPRRFWEEADKYERENGAAYREHEISLPNGLTLDQQIQVAMQHIDDIAGDKSYQFAIHAAESSLDARPNVHLHLMISDRLPDGINRPPAQMFRRYNRIHPEKGGCRKDSGGLGPLALRDKVIELRKRTADVQNAVLTNCGLVDRVDHRSLKAQGKNRKPERYLGQARIRKMSDEEKVAFLTSRQEQG